VIYKTLRVECTSRKPDRFISMQFQSAKTAESNRSTYGIPIEIVKTGKNGEKMMQNNVILIELDFLRGHGSG